MLDKQDLQSIVPLLDELLEAKLAPIRSDIKDLQASYLKLASRLDTLNDNTDKTKSTALDIKDTLDNSVDKLINLMLNYRKPKSKEELDFERRYEETQRRVDEAMKEYYAVMKELKEHRL